MFASLNLGFYVVWQFVLLRGLALKLGRYIGISFHFPRGDARSEAGESYISTAIVLPTSILVLGVLLEIFRVTLLAFNTQELASVSAGYFANPVVSQGVNVAYQVGDLLKEQPDGDSPGLKKDRKAFWVKFLHSKGTPTSEELAALNKAYGYMSKIGGGKVSFPIPESIYKSGPISSSNPGGSGQGTLGPNIKSGQLKGTSCTLSYTVSEYLGVGNGNQRMVTATCILQTPFAAILGNGEYLRIERKALVPS